MINVRNVAIFIGTVSFFTFVGLFGQLPALRRTPIGWLQRALCIHIPRTLRRIDDNLTGGEVSRHGSALGHYLFYRKNPVVLVGSQSSARPYLLIEGRSCISYCLLAQQCYFCHKLLQSCHSHSLCQFQYCYSCLISSPTCVQRIQATTLQQATMPHA